MTWDLYSYTYMPALHIPAIYMGLLGLTHVFPHPTPPVPAPTPTPFTPPTTPTFFFHPTPPAPHTHPHCEAGRNCPARAYMCLQQWDWVLTPLQADPYCIFLLQVWLDMAWVPLTYLVDPTTFWLCTLPPSYEFPCSFPFCLLPHLQPSSHPAFFWKGRRAPARPPLPLPAAHLPTFNLWTVDDRCFVRWRTFSASSVTWLVSLFIWHFCRSRSHSSVHIAKRSFCFVVCRGYSTAHFPTTPYHFSLPASCSATFVVQFPFPHILPYTFPPPTSRTPRAYPLLTVLSVPATYVARVWTAPIL